MMLNLYAARFVLLLPYTSSIVVAAVSDDSANFRTRSSDLSGTTPNELLCSSDNASVTLSVRSVLSCSSLCQKHASNGCTAFNVVKKQVLSGTRQPIDCQLFYYRPSCFNVTTDCTYYRNQQLKSVLTGVNLALHRPTTQSADFYHGTFANHGGISVDGNLASYHHTQVSIARPYNGGHAWWAVDLGQAIKVKRVLIRKRKIVLTHQLADFHIGLTNRPLNAHTPGPAERCYSLCDNYPGSPPSGALVNVYCRSETEPGRYLFVRHNTPCLLAMGEVMVYA